LGATAVAYKLRGVLVPAAEALIRGIPIATPQALILTDLPVAQGPRISLFNGVDLNEWMVGWVIPTRRKPTGTPIQLIQSARGIGINFKVVLEDGESAIYVSGKPVGKPDP
jgi:hypothetical protein